MTPSALRCVVPWLVVVATLITGCASAPTGGPSRSTPAVERDGPPSSPPPDLANVPDAEPKLEPIRPGGPNKPYVELGRSYVPIARDAPFTERGLASWYGRAFHGRRTASGEVYNMYAMTAAHPTLPIPSYVRVRNPANGREVVLRINDRGPFHGGRAIDLSYAAAVKLDLTRGVGLVEIQRITDDDIRSGAWRRDGGTALAAASPAPADSIVPVVATAGETAPASAPPTVQAPAPAPPSTTASAVAAAVAVADAPPARAFTIPSRGFWVQLGAFRQRDGAEGFQQRVGASVDWLAPLLAVFGEAGLFKLQAGPYPSRDDARLAAERIRDGLRLVPVIVERR